MDPILEYLLELNSTTALEYSDRYLIPVGGLAKMLENFSEYHLNRVEVAKEEIKPNENWAKSTIEDADSIEELYALLD